MKAKIRIVFDTGAIWVYEHPETYGWTQRPICWNMKWPGGREVYIPVLCIQSIDLSQED